ncbi:hypothetical protein BSPWISOXPB_1562 [uncultured Gammaproteobacteria bacterium]|nr:hypothetical protein BSPWISOXPB_1562 [uncultured Gammaproteobacteria bacterium]
MVLLFFEFCIISELPQNIVKKVKTEINSKKYSGFIKLDVSNFYPTIKHCKILEELQKKLAILKS